MLIFPWQNEDVIFLFKCIPGVKLLFSKHNIRLGSIFFYQCNTRFRLIHLLYDIEAMWRKSIKQDLYPNKTYVFDPSERAQGPIYVIKQHKDRHQGQSFIGHYIRL